MFKSPQILSAKCRGHIINNYELRINDTQRNYLCWFKDGREMIMVRNAQEPN